MKNVLGQRIKSDLALHCHLFSYIHIIYLLSHPQAGFCHQGPAHSRFHSLSSDFGPPTHGRYVCNGYQDTVI